MEDSLHERRRTAGGLHVSLTNLLCYSCRQQFDSEDEFRNHSHCDDNNMITMSENPITTNDDEFLQVKVEVESEPELEPNFDPLATTPHDSERNDVENENSSAQESNDDNDSDYNIQNSRTRSNRKRKRGRPRNSSNSQRNSTKRNRGSTKLLDLNISKRKGRTDLYLDDTKENVHQEEEKEEVNNFSNLTSTSQIVVVPPQRKLLRCLENLDEIQVYCEVCAIKYTSLKLFMQHLYSEVRHTVDDNNKTNRRDEIVVTTTTIPTTSSIVKRNSGNFCLECKATFSTIQLYKNHIKNYHSQKQQKTRSSLVTTKKDAQDFKRLNTNDGDNSNSRNYDDDDGIDDSENFSPPDTDMMENMEENDDDNSENEEDKNMENENNNTGKSGYQLAKRIHKCKLCAKKGINKAFKFKCHLRRHIDCHYNNRLDRPRKTYECEGCGHNFRGKLDLTRHLGNDLDTLKPCIYDSCNETFVYKCLLRNHLRDHRGIEENPYKCNFKNCQKSFPTPEQLNHHVTIKLHSWEFHRPPSSKSTTPTTTTTTVATTKTTTFKITTPKRVAQSSTVGVPKVIKSESLAKSKNNSSKIPPVQSTATIKSDTIKPAISLKIEEDDPNPNSSTTTTNDNNMIENNKDSSPILDFENCLLMDDDDNITLDTELITPGSPSSLICNSPLSISHTNDDDDDDTNQDEESTQQDLVDHKIVVKSASQKIHKETEMTEQDSKSKRRCQRTIRDDNVKRSSSADVNNSDDDDDNNDNSSNSGFEKKYKCETCSKAFKFQCQLRRHSFIHINHKPPKDMRCPGCSRIFLTRENHRQHVHSNQLLANESRLQCPFEDSCPDLTYNYRCALKQHVQTHIARGQKPKPHACNECPLRFRSAYDLKKHQKVHDKQRKGYKRKYRPNKYSDNDDNDDSENDASNSSTPQTGKKRHSGKTSQQVSNNNDNSNSPPQNVGKKKTKEEKLAEKSYKYATMKRKHKCETCAEEGIVKSFKFRCHLRRHLFTHQNIVRYPGNDNRKPPLKKYECPGCHKMFAFNREFNQHKAANSGFLRDELLTGETQQTEDNEGDGKVTKQRTKTTFKCAVEVCGAEFEWRCAYRNHIHEHKEQGVKPKPYPCTFEGCRQRFANKYDRNQHYKRHANEKSYLCNLCGKALSSAKSLEFHVLNHEGDSHKPFKCDVEGCNRRFVNSQLLSQHKRTVHLGIRNYLCNTCGSSFKQPGNLSTHMLTHSEVKKLECEVCGHRFHTLGQKMEHMKKHENRRTHKCDFCDKAFNARSTLRRHIFTHTGEKRAKCPYCPKAYPDPRTLRNHVSRHHPEKNFHPQRAPNANPNSNVTQANYSSTQNNNSDDSDSYSE